MVPNPDMSLRYAAVVTPNGNGGEKRLVPAALALRSYGLWKRVRPKPAKTPPVVYLFIVRNISMAIS